MTLSEVQQDKFYKSEEWGKELTLFFKVGIMSRVTGKININITTKKSNLNIRNLLLYHLIGKVEGNIKYQENIIS